MKKIFTIVIIGVVFVFMSNSCDDSLGIEENYNQKLISGKDISEKSYKEYVLISHDTLIFYSDTLSYLDTTHIKIYDTIPSGYKSLPNRGMVYSKDNITFLLFGDEILYAGTCSISNSKINLSYDYWDKPHLTLDMNIDFNYPDNNEIFESFREIPIKLDLKINEIKPRTYGWYNISSDNNDNLLKFYTSDSKGSEFYYSNPHIRSYLKINELIRSPENGNHLLLMNASINVLYDYAIVTIPFSIIFF